MLQSLIEAVFGLFDSFAFFWGCVDCNRSDCLFMLLGDRLRTIVALLSTGGGGGRVGRSCADCKRPDSDGRGIFLLDGGLRTIVALLSSEGVGGSVGRGCVDCNRHVSDGVGGLIAVVALLSSSAGGGGGSEALLDNVDPILILTRS